MKGVWKDVKFNYFAGYLNQRPFLSVHLQIQNIRIHWNDYTVVPYRVYKSYIIFRIIKICQLGEIHVCITL